MTIITPVAPGGAAELREALHALAREPVSPFSGVLPPTHFARFVVIELDDGDRAARWPHLLFSARFDGPVRAYLTALAATPEAQALFGLCRLPDGVRADDPGSLAAHLGDRRTRLNTPYTVSAVPAGATVEAVNNALALREELHRFLTSGRFGRVGTVTMHPDPIGAVHDLRQLPSIQRLMEEP